LYLDFAATTSLDPRITFSRTTNATVTGSNGLIQNAPMNLLTFSEQFDNAAWAKTNATVTANQVTAPDGTTTADKLVEDATTAVHRISQAPTTSVSAYSFSVYVKGAERSFVQLRDVGAAVGVWFNLTTGVVGTQNSGITGFIESVGNDWYRCTAIRTTVATNVSWAIAPADADASNIYTGNGTSGLFIWGAQLNLGSTATTYNPTTVKNLLGFTENFDNAAWTKSNAFVQTNIRTYSQDFDNAVWASTNLNQTGTPAWVNVTTAPDGSQTADKLIATAVAGLHRVVGGALATTSGSGYTMSLFVKQGEYAKVGIGEFNNGVGYATFNVLTGVVISVGGTGSPTAAIQSVGNGWFRCSLTFTAAAFSRFDVYALNNSYTTGDPASYTYTGDGTSGIFIWGAQLVQGTSAGDYKATYAAAAAVGYTDIYGQPFAQKLVEDTANSAHRAFGGGVSVTLGTPYTFTFYAKAAERTWVTAQGNAAGLLGLTYFNLANGTLGTVPAGTAASITSVGNGWYRCSLTRTANATASVSFIIYTAFADEVVTYTGDGTSGIYIFGAQLSDSASVDPYVYQPVAAPTSTAYYGPRFDYDPVTLAPKGLLIEEQRTNLLTYSEQFDNVAWNSVFGNCTVTANAAVSPSGATTGDSLVPSAASTTHSLYQTIALTLGASYTMTVYAKPNGYNRFMLREGTTAGYFVVFDVSTGTVVNTNSATGTITPAGNGWYRCTMTITAPLTVATVMAIINMPNNGTTYANATFTGDGTSGVLLWGAQLEAGAFATSYIPTVASQVTRAADNASMIGNNFARWYNVNEGTLYADAYMVTAASVLGVSDGTTFNRIQVGMNTSSNQFLYVANNSVQALFTGPFSVLNSFNKLAFAYKTDSFAGTVNAGTPGVDTSGSVTGNLDRLQIGSRTGVAEFVNAPIKRITYYPRRLANTELTSITS
jgi:hypothetical protein